MENSNKYTVVCMKWGTKYGPEYVNRLYNTAKRNLTLPFRFVCYTDDSKNFESGIEARPLPEMEIPNDNERGWRKLALFRKDVGLEGRVLFMDLDTVIVANIDDYFTVDGDFIFIRHWKPSKKQGVGQTSVYRFEAGVLDFLYANFIANMPKYRAQYRHEQAYVSGELGKLGKLNFWPSEWMPSFKYNCMYPFPLNFFLEPKLPPKAKIIVFHGNPTPDQALSGKTKGFLKGILRYVRTPKWLIEKWH